MAPLLASGSHFSTFSCPWCDRSGTEEFAGTSKSDSDLPREYHGTTEEGWSES